MSFGSLSGPAIEALNRGATLAGCLQNTGEGGVSPCHRNGGELIFQIGTAYFGCRDGHPRECDLADITPPTRTLPWLNQPCQIRSRPMVGLSFGMDEQLVDGRHYAAVLRS
jgi:hypothetical protein